MGFSSGSFILAGTAIAIAGVGLYVWDTRGSKLFSSSTPSTIPTTNGYIPPTNQVAGKSFKNKRKSNKKTKRH